jgi:NAD+ kinase
MKNIGLAVHPTKEAALEVAAQLAEWLADRQLSVKIESGPAEAIGHPEMAGDVDQIYGSDLVVVLGGDGTILRASRLAGPRGTPMLGIHFGQYGFITEVHPPDLYKALERVFKGDYQISERLMLTARLYRSEREIGSWTSLNDVVVAKGPLARILRLRTYVDNKYLATYAADGIIVASPTGSTAYSLSAGGPVVNPDVDALILTPICPHTLNARSLVLPGGQSVQVVAECGPEEPRMMLTVDGQIGYELQCFDKIDIRKAEFTAKIVRWDPKSFYDKIHSRLRWGERFSE